MNKNILLSPRYGANPTIPLCFWCGKERMEVALLGRIHNSECDDLEAPRHMVIDYEPCEECKNNMSLGFTVIEATTTPNSVTNMEIQKGVYPTGRAMIITTEAAHRVFKNLAHDISKAFVDVELFTQLFE